MKILAVDTSCGAASAAIAEDSNIIAEATVNNKKTHSQKLMPIIDSLLSNSGTQLSDIDLFAAVTGPGSFTGLRIGVAAVKALAHAMNKPCCGVSSLLGLAYNAPCIGGYAIPVMDARRDHVYTAAYDFSGGSPKLIHKERVVPIDELAADCETLDNGYLLFIGDAAPLHRDYLEKRFGGRAHFAEANVNINRASSVALAAASAEITDYLHLNPVYMRKPQAQRELEEKMRRNKQKREEESG